MNKIYAIHNTSKNVVNIFILIDALGWNYIKGRPFLDDIAVTKKSIKSILGFSSGVIPSILTGKYPQQHKHWSLYFYSPQTSPFRWTKGFLWLPKRVLNSRLAIKIVEEISKRIMGYTGYFETYAIPVEELHLFDICENRNIYKPSGIRGAESIFDILNNKNVEYKSFTYPLKDREIFSRTKSALEESESPFYFLYLSETDAMLHRSCRNIEQVDAMIDYYEKEIQDIYRIARTRFKKVNLFVFSDHSMAPVDNSFNLKREINRLGFKAPEDYAVFYDSTMARFWFLNPKAKNAILRVLKNKDYGRVLPHSELKRLGLNFIGNMYGEVIFLINTGSVISPSFMGSKAPKGMHGFNVDDGVMDAVLVSNRKVRQRINNVKEFFNLMLNAAADEPNPKTKVLYFLNSTVRAGAEEHILELIKHLDRKKFEPVLVCPQKLIDVIKEDLEKINVRFYPVHIRRWRNIGEIRKFLAILKKEKPDIIHSHLFLATMFAAPIAKFAGIAQVVETAHIRESWRKGIKRAYFIDRFFYRFVDKIIAVSDAVKEYLIAEKKLPQDKIRVVRNGVDTERFKPFRSKSTKIGFRIGVIGRLEPQKGHKYFLEAIRILDGKVDNAKCLIVGEGKLRNYLEKMSEELGIKERVEFLGFRKDIQEIMAKLDLVVLPSLYEGLPLVAIEASAMAKPVVVTDVDGSPDVIQHSQTGLVVPAKDPIALARAITFISENKEAAKKYGENGRKFVSQYFDIRQQVRNTEELYKSLVKG